MSHLEQDPFSEAAQQFNLDKLRRALEESDGLQVTDAPWMQFKGILCGYDAREIAEKLNLPKNASKGIRVSLSRDVAPKIRLILDYPETKKRIDWDKVPRYLLAKGYGIEAEIETIDWSGKCKEVLTFNRELAINLFTADMGVTIELDQIHVPLGLIERKEKPKIAGDVETEQGSRIYKNLSEETTTKIPYSIFENEVLPEFKSSSNRIISILGEAGSGKTVQLLKIAQWILEQGDLPIFISLGSIPIKENIKEVKLLRDYLFDDWLKQFSYQVPSQWSKDLEFQLKQGKVWLLLDGADEIVGYSDPLGYLSESLSIPLFQNVKVIITCRSNLWEIGANALASLSNKTYRMMRFEYGDNNLETDTVSQFIDQWFKSSNPALGQTLRQALDEPGKERIRDLVTHPLMLSLLCFSWQYLDGKLPDTKASLYKDFADAIYELKKGKSFVDKEDRFKLEEVLGKLALESIEKGYKSILPYELVNKILQQPHPKLFKLAIKLNWLNDIGVKSNTRQPVYSFFHPSFQEYFAALAIDDWTFFLNHNNDNPNPFKKYNGKDCIYRIFDLNWQQVILMWLGILNKENKSLFVESLFDFKDGLTGYFYQYQAQFLISLATTEYLHQYTDQLLEYLVERAFTYRWFSHPSSVIARDIILKTNKIITLSKLINFLNLNCDQCFLNGVIWSFQQIGRGSLEVISSLTNVIFAYPNSDHADYAIECLGRIAIGHDETTQLMLYIINNTSNTNFLAQQSTKVRAAKALADICPEQKITAINFLLSIVNDENIAFSTICTAAYNLFQIDGKKYKEKAIKILVNLYENSDSNNWNTYFPKDKWFFYEYVANHLSKVDPNNLVIEKIIGKNNLSLDYPDSIEELIQLGSSGFAVGEV